MQLRTSRSRGAPLSLRNRLSIIWVSLVLVGFVLVRLVGSRTFQQLWSKLT